MIRQLIRQATLALQFMTRLPLPAVSEIEDKDIGYSQYFYPLAGLVIGLILLSTVFLSQWLFAFDSYLLQAALVLFVWVILTGALHLDGLADCADAWVGGYGDRDKTLAIMKDPCSGPVAVSMIVIVLLVKLAAIQQILKFEAYSMLILAPVLARTLVIILFQTSDYCRKEGLGEQLKQVQSLKLSLLCYLIVISITFAVIGLKSLIVIISLVISLLIIRNISLIRLKGITGDVAGALIELAEIVTLLAFLSQI